MDETPNTNVTGAGSGPRIPRAHLWIVGGLLLLLGIGMYVGTMYRIQNFGYVGIGDDRPLQSSAPSATKPN